MFEIQFSTNKEKILISQAKFLKSLEISIFINHSLIIIYGDENSATFTQANDDALTWLKWIALNLISDSLGSTRLHMFTHCSS